VAELAIGLIIALDRRIADNVAELRAGRWDKSAFAKAKGLEGRTLGLLGFSALACFCLGYLWLVCSVSLTLAK